MVCFQTQNHTLGKLWWVLHWKMLIYFMALWSIFRPFGIFCVTLVYFVVIWYILWLFGIFCGYLVHFPRFGTSYHEKSGNPERKEREREMNVTDEARIGMERGESGVKLNHRRAQAQREAK
jgi:fatty acid desaturase